MKVIAWLLFSIVLVVVFARVVLGVDLISFDASRTPNVTYRVRWGAASGTVDGFLNIGTNTFATLTNGPWGTLYYTVTAVSTNGVESYPSIEVIGTNRPYAPTQLRIIEGAGLIIETTFDGLTWFPVLTNQPTELMRWYRASVF